MFKEGDRVRIELFELNLQHGAGEEYPHLGTGTVGVPVQKKTENWNWIQKRPSGCGNRGLFP